ncbi:hypothetical protein BDZ94DRAFT_1256384 [Collybia nuda]|uniref:BRCT domain-containing protein n=1 Tax=Collybia nuda TaxID=64659 RepID=A0A9P5Y949_9AGAR|nr:hypothetical protein BDZ94DRAFT_1256384 [Collybia nuda]
MEQYFPIISKHSALWKVEKHRRTTKHSPYERKLKQGSDVDDPLPADLKPSPSTITKFLLATLADQSNPITHSDIGERSGRIVSTSTGHQVSEGQRDRRLYFEDRQEKLTHQWSVESPVANDEHQVLKNVRVYINGVLSGTTDIEMKRIIIRAGGQVVLTATACTHILTSQHLSGSKTQRIITSRSRSRVQVVKPEWVFDSIAAGKKRPEREYEVIKDTTMKSIYDMLK